MLALVPDYRVNLIAPASIEDKDFGKFQSSLKEVLSFIKYAANKNELKRLLDTDKAFHRLGREEVDVLNACVGAKIAVKEGEEAIDVCLEIQTFGFLHTNPTTPLFHPSKMCYDYVIVPLCVLRLPRGRAKT